MSNVNTKGFYSALKKLSTCHMLNIKYAERHAIALNPVHMGRRQCRPSDMNLRQKDRHNLRMSKLCDFSLRTRNNFNTAP